MQLISLLGNLWGSVFPFVFLLLCPGNFVSVNFLFLQVHQLPPEKLKHRDVVHIDIANDKIEPRDYIKHEDPTLFHSQKTGRGPLVGKWQEQVMSLEYLAKARETVMCKC